MPRKQDWAATKISGLYRHKRSGRYHVRAYRQGREIWKALGTASFEVAKVKARETLSEIHKSRHITESIADGRPTFGQVAELHRERVRTATDTKESTKTYWLQTVDALLRSWDGLETTRVSAITADDCRRWASGYLKSKRASGFGWKSEGAGKNISASRFNNTLSSLRSVFQIGIENGIILSNPAASVARVAPRAKPMRIPSREDFRRIVAEVRGAGGATSQGCGDLLEFLAFSGCRIDESRWVRWTDVDRERKQIWIAGHERTGTKSGDGRWIPIVADMARLLDDLEATPRYTRSAKRRDGSFVLAVTECQKSIDRACKRLEIARFSHHDLRHLFATACIESGCDFLVLAHWL